MKIDTDKVVEQVNQNSGSQLVNVCFNFLAKKENIGKSFDYVQLTAVINPTEESKVLRHSVQNEGVKISKGGNGKKEFPITLDDGKKGFLLLTKKGSCRLSFNLTKQLKEIPTEK